MNCLEHFTPKFTQLFRLIYQQYIKKNKEKHNEAKQNKR
jgi:hypothetical protein